MAKNVFTFSKICHLDISDNLLSDRLLEAFHLLNNSYCASITLPLLALGSDRIVRGYQAVMRALNEFVDSASILWLTRIDVCIERADKYNELLRTIGVSTLSPQIKVAYCPQSSSSSLSLSSAQAQDKSSSSSQDCANKIKFKLISDRQDRIDRCKKMIDDLMAEFETQEYSDDYLEPSNADVVNKIERLCKRNNVNFTWHFDQHMIKVSFSTISLSIFYAYWHEK